MRDITERRQTERELAQYRDHLEELVRERTTELEAANAELAAFSYSVSHDLRGPLRAMDGFAQALLEDCGEHLDAAGKDHLARIRRASQRMGQLIDDLLRLSRVTRAEMNHEPVDLAHLAREVIDDLRQLAPQRQVDFRVADTLPARGDACLLKVLLEHLLGNAWKFTGHTSAPQIELGLAQRTPNPVYFVRDNGAGFDMAYSNKLFGAFQRLHSSEEFEGTGIGLATAERIVARHGGRVWAEGETGQGATFFFTLSPERGSDHAEEGHSAG